MSDSGLSHSSLVSLQYEFDDLHEVLSKKIDILSVNLEKAEKFIDIIRRRQEFLEMKKRREVVDIKPHHGNYSSASSKGDVAVNRSTERHEKRELMRPAVSNDSRKSSYESESSTVSSSKSSYDTRSKNVSKQPLRRDVRENRSKRRIQEKKRKIPKKTKKRLPLHVSKKTVVRKNEKNEKIEGSMGKLESVLRLARKTRKLIKEKEKSRRIRDQFTQKRMNIHEQTTDEIIEESSSRDVERVDESEKSTVSTSTDEEKKVKRKKQQQRSIKKARKKTTKPKKQRILKSNIPYSREKIRKEMEEIEEPIIEQNEQYTDKPLHSEPQISVKELPVNLQPEEPPTEIEEEKPQNMVRNIERQIRLIRAQQKKLRVSKKKLEDASQHFISTSISPFSDELQSQKLIQMSFQLGIYDYLKTVNEIMFQSFNVGEEQDNQNEEEEESEEEDDPNLSRIRKEVGFIDRWIREKDIMDEYESSCVRLMYEDELENEKNQSRQETEEKDEINPISYIQSMLHDMKVKSPSISPSDDPSKRFIWLPIRIYKNINELLHPKHLISGPDCSLLSYHSNKQLRRLYDGRSKFQDGLLYHYIEKIVAKNLMAKNDAFMEIRRKKEGGIRPARNLLLLWRFLHSVLTQKAKCECSFVKKEEKRKKKRKNFGDKHDEDERNDEKEEGEFGDEIRSDSKSENYEDGY